MKQLNTYPLKRTYYVNDGIIYNIVNSTAKTSDSHAKIYDGSKTFPHLTYKSKEEGDYIYYLDSLIEDGDKLDDFGAFSKVCHEIDGEPEKTPFEYFKYLCEMQISKVIADNPDRNYDFYYGESINRLDVLGVPMYMFKQNYDGLIYNNMFGESDGHNDRSVTKNDVIDFTKEKYDELLENEIKRRAKAAANAAIKRYDKEVNELTIKDIA